jgi:hypothetical protein
MKINVPFHVIHFQISLLDWDFVLLLMFKARLSEKLHVAKLLSDRPRRGPVRELFGLSLKEDDIKSSASV